MNVKPLPVETKMLKRMIGSEALSDELIECVQDHRHGFLNAGGTGPLPAMTLLSIAVFSGAVRAERTPPEAPQPMPPADDGVSEMERLYAQMEAENGHAHAEEAAPPEPVAGVPDEPVDTYDGLTHGRMINFREKGKFYQGRYHGPAKDPHCVMVTTANRRNPFAVHKKNVEVPDISKPAPTTY